MAAYPLTPCKLRLHLVELFRRNDRLMTVFHIILRHLSLIDLSLFREEIDREAFLAEWVGFEPTDPCGSNDFGSRWENVTEQGKITEPDSNPVFD